MTIKTISKRILFYLSVPTCVFCNERIDFDDEGICKKCKIKYENHKTRGCSKCSKKLSECTCPTQYLAKHSIKRHIKIFRYMDRGDAEPGKHLIYSLKRDNREDVIEFLSKELAEAIKSTIDITDTQKFLITSVPRRKSSIIKYGFNHSEILAKSLSKHLKIEYRSLLISNTKHAQKEMIGTERLFNVNFDYKPCVKPNLQGKIVFIIDDLVTTGASMSASAMLIRGLGARECIAVSIAVAHNEDYNL